MTIAFSLQANLLLVREPALVGGSNSCAVASEPQLFNDFIAMP
jgi:hypothetical protein